MYIVFHGSCNGRIIIKFAGSAVGSPNLNGIKVGFSEECKMQ
jgi:hypothetical protein